MKNIVIFLPDPCVSMSAALLHDLLFMAASYCGEDYQSPNIQLISISGASVKSFTGKPIAVDGDLSLLSRADAVFLAAFSGSITSVLTGSSPLIEALGQLVERQVPIAAVSNAPFFLAEAGLLAGKIATVYPPTAAVFKKRYPSVNLQTERAITDAGNLYCAHGIASGCDLTVSMVEKMLGEDCARRLSQEFLHDFKRNYEIADMQFDGQKYHQDPTILAAQAWLEQHFAEPISLQELAQQQSMSPRNFSRRFKLATGETASQYLTRLRIEKAKSELLGNEDPVSEIGYRVGFADVSHFNRQFLRMVGCTPKEFRQQHTL